jgi:non-homologous end joining protein Ku
MRGDNHLLAVTTTTDEVTGEVKPLFAFPIQVCKATDDKEATFDIAGPSGAPRKQQYIDSGTGEVITDDDCQRGVRIGNEFKPIPADAIEKIEEATKVKTMVALGQIPVSDIPWERTTAVYFVQSPAKGGSPKSYRLVYEALKAKRGKKGVPGEPARAIVTKRTPRSRQVLAAIYADESLGCLMMVQLRYANSLKAPDEQVLAPQLAQVEEKQIDMARKVIANLPDGAAALENEQDEALPLRAELIEQALAGIEVTAPTPVAETAAATDLTAMLEASLAAV